ncbi:putative serine/threonine-protein kinase, partial [Trifolium medium]|nr:putative serine/threonine-protein kinase [Trifolium medium]
GKLQDGRRVAVKMLNEYIHNRNALFMTEVQNLAKLSHPNLVHFAQKQHTYACL